MLNIPPHLEACRPRGLFSIFHGTSSPVARRCPRASDLVLSAEHAFLLYERPGLHLQSGASAVGGVLHGARRQVWAGLADPMRISIRAPRAGCDRRQRRGCQRHGRFQSTHPVRGATELAWGNAPGTVFQSTHPVRGATTALSTADTVIYFNPRTPCGVRHAPCVKFRRRISDFNPRTPCVVRPLLCDGPGILRDFNPRAPCGARLAEA